MIHQWLSWGVLPDSIGHLIFTDMHTHLWLITADKHQPYLRSLVGVVCLTGALHLLVLVYPGLVSC